MAARRAIDQRIVGFLRIIRFGHAGGGGRIDRFLHYPASEGYYGPASTAHSETVNNGRVPAIAGEVCRMGHGGRRRGKRPCPPSRTTIRVQDAAEYISGPAGRVSVAKALPRGVFNRPKSEPARLRFRFGSCCVSAAARARRNIQGRCRRVPRRNGPTWGIPWFRPRRAAIPVRPRNHIARRDCRW